MTRVITVVVLSLVGLNASADEAGKKLLKDLEGSYTAVSMTRSGELAPDEFLKTVSFAIKGDTLTVRFKKGENSEDKTAKLVVDASQKPIAIQMTPSDGPDAGKAMLGIMKVEKDTITLCWADRSDKPERPKEFKSTKDDNNLLIVMKKK